MWRLLILELLVILNLDLFYYLSVSIAEQTCYSMGAGRESYR